MVPTINVLSGTNIVIGAISKQEFSFVLFTFRNHNYDVMYVLCDLEMYRHLSVCCNQPCFSFSW